ncbi:MAG: isocitrate lyase/PEP mutase family protein [Deltaproteobacteria bacterium]|nr:isocitrate lyase/PEP mutase family protein [Deltaproteobacteria bacterium]
MYIKGSTKYREMINQPGTIFMPGVYDSLSAKLAERAGFKIITHTGYGTAASLLGMPDVGLVSFKEMCERVTYIARSVNIPLMTDADTGYGNSINVYRTIKEYIGGGAAGLFIEDQVWPKKCGHMAGKNIIPSGEMVGKIRAAIDSRNEYDPDFVVGARTDAIATHGFDEALKRAKLYSQAGADFILIDAYETIDQMKKAVQEVKIPLMVNLVEGGKTPLIDSRQAQEIGFKMVCFPLTTLLSATRAMIRTLEKLKETYSPQSYIDDLTSWSEFNEIIGVPEVRKMEEKYT